MDVVDAMNSRFTCRAFKKDCQIKKDTLMLIIKEATRSPSWANTQPWEIYIAGGEVLERIRNQYMENFRQDVTINPEVPWVEKWPSEHEERIKDLGVERFKHLGLSSEDEQVRKESRKLNFKFFDAPAVVYLCMDKNLTEWSIFDLGSLSQSIMLAAQGHGVDSAPAVNLVSYPYILRNEIGIPDRLSIVFGIALGYKDRENPQNTFRSSRRPLKEVLTLKGF
jgi:nitroreductase